MNTVPSQPFWTIVQPGGEEPPAPLATDDELLALLPGTYYMDPPDGGSVTVLEQLQRMAADAARYREQPPPVPTVMAWPADMDEDVAFILGMMCFQCASFAQILRLGGHTIATKAEAEQAAVIHWMLGLYFKHGKDWRTAAQADMERMSPTTLKGTK